MLKDKFQFKHHQDYTTLYTAERMEDDYSITWEEDGKLEKTIYPISSVEEFVLNEKWIINDNDLKCEYDKLREEFITLEKMYDSLWEEHELLKSKLHNEETLNNQKTYIIDYKHPQDDKNTDSRFKFKGKLDNFNPNGLCAFTNEEGVMLHIRYKDIIQMRPLKESK